MQHFKIQDFSSRKEVDLKKPEILLFPVNKQRTIKVEFFSTDMVEVWCLPTDQKGREVLLAVSGGQFSVEFTAKSDVQITFVSQAEDARLFYQCKARDQRVYATTEEKFTEIAPRQRQSSEMQQILQIMKINEEQRQLTVDREMARMKRRLEKAEARNEERDKRKADRLQAKNANKLQVELVTEDVNQGDEGSDDAASSD